MTIFVCLLAVALSPAVLLAQSIAVRLDGCAILARVVYSEVFAAAQYGPGRSGPWVVDFGQGDVLVCESAAKTVSQAFTSAMAVAGFGVSWHSRGFAGSRQAEGFCRNVFLSQCRPDRLPPANQPSDPIPEYVRNTWSVVSGAVMREMYNPHSSDEVRFRDSELRLQIGLLLRSVHRPEPY